MAKIKLLIDTDILIDSPTPSLLSRIKILRIDDDINKKYLFLMKKYEEKSDLIADYIIAATAWSKKLPLLTRNKKHFIRIEEIVLSPSYDIEST
jgi:predicted nucleic acid-binding protein